MNVKKLREIIADLPDETPVFLMDDNEGDFFPSMAYRLQAKRDEIGNYHAVAYAYPEDDAVTETVVAICQNEEY